jgi:Glyoxalase-like domain
MMAVRYQFVIDCADPDLLAHFWAAALRYQPEPPPAGFTSWNDYWRDVGVPEAELGRWTVAMKDPEGNEFDIN